MRKNESIDWLVESGYKVHYQIKIYQIWKWKVSHYVLVKIISLLEIIFKKANYNKQEYSIWENSQKIMVLDKFGTIRFLYLTPKKEKRGIIRDIKNQKKYPKETKINGKNAFEDFHQEMEDLRKKKKMNYCQN